MSSVEVSKITETTRAFGEKYRTAVTSRVVSRISTNLEILCGKYLGIGYPGDEFEANKICLYSDSSKCCASPRSNILFPLQSWEWKWEDYA